MVEQTCAVLQYQGGINGADVAVPIDIDFGWAVERDWEACGVLKDYGAIDRVDGSVAIGIASQIGLCASLPDQQETNDGHRSQNEERERVLRLLAALERG